MENSGGNTVKPNVGVPGRTYDTPYNVNLGGGYSFRKFVGESPIIAKDTVKADTNYYLDKAESYIKGLVNGFKGPEKFQNLINAIQNTNNYRVNNGAYTIDNINNSFRPCEEILKDIISNLGDYDDYKENYIEREAFKNCYSVLNSEAYYQGYGDTRDVMGNIKEEYEDNKTTHIQLAYPYNKYCQSIDLAACYDRQDFTPVANLMDRLLAKAAGKMNVKTADLHQVVNIALNGTSFQAMHNLVGPVLEHSGCSNRFSPESVIYNQITDLKLAEKDQSASLSL